LGTFQCDNLAFDFDEIFGQVLKSEYTGQKDAITKALLGIPSSDATSLITTITNIAQPLNLNSFQDDILQEWNRKWALFGYSRAAYANLFAYLEPLMSSWSCNVKLVEFYSDLIRLNQCRAEINFDSYLLMIKVIIFIAF
jgi:hypothetical protein